MALEDFFEDFRFMDWISVSDGMGGFEMELKQGAPFQAGISANDSNEAVIADRLGTKAIFTITTRLNVELEQNDVVYRVKDQRKYRITGNAMDTTTPARAFQQYRCVNAEVIV